MADPTKMTMNVKVDVLASIPALAHAIQSAHSALDRAEAKFTKMAGNVGVVIDGSISLDEGIATANREASEFRTLAHICINALDAIQIAVDSVKEANDVKGSN